MYINQNINEYPRIRREAKAKRIRGMLIEVARFVCGALCLVVILALGLVLFF